MSTSTLPSPASSRSRFKTVLWLGLGRHDALCLHHVRGSSRHRLPDVPRLPPAGDRRPASSHSAHALRNLRSAGRPTPVLVTFSAAPPASSIASSAASISFPSLSGLSPGSLSLRAARASRNLHAGRCMDRLHDRCLHRRAQPADRRASPVDGPLLCGHVYLRLQPCAQPCACLLEPSWRCLSAVGVIAFTLASILLVDLGLNWHELTTRRE